MKMSAPRRILRRDRIIGIVAIVAFGVAENVLQSFEANQRLVSALGWRLTPATERLRVRTWFTGCAVLFGLAGAIRYVFRHSWAGRPPAAL